MESLFTRSPHSITPFTRSQLTSFPTTGYSIPLSPYFFYPLSAQGNILIALLNISHILRAHLRPSHTCINVAHKHHGKNQKRIAGRNSLRDTEVQKHVF